MTSSTSHPRARTLGLGALFLLVGLFAAIVGLVDALSAGNLTGRLIGLVLVAAAGLLLLCAAGVLVEHAQAPQLAVAGALAAAGVGAYFLYANLQGFGVDARIAAWSLIIAGACAALVVAVLWVRETSGSLTKAGRRVALSAVSVGSILAVLQFWYTAAYVPSTHLPFLTLRAELSEGATATTAFHPLVARIELQNTSDRKVMVLGSVYRVIGARIGSRDGPSSGGAAGTQRSSCMRGNAQNSFFCRRVLEEIEVGEVIQRRSEFEPTQVYLADLSIPVPAGRFDVAGLTVEVIVADAERLVLGSERAYPPRDSPYVRGTESDIVEQSWVDRLTRPGRVVRSLWVEPPMQGPRIVALVAARGAGDPPGLRPDAEARRLDRHYRISVVVATATAALSDRATEGASGPG